METSLLPYRGEVKETDKEEVVEEDPLHEQLKKLEREWSTFKQSKPPQNSHQCSTDSNLTEDYFQSLMENSPRDPVSSLVYHGRLSSEGYSSCNWRQNDKATVEILKERWDSIESGKLKGKRLFEDLSTEEEEDICSECFNLVQESEEGLMSACAQNENAVPDCCYCYSSSTSESEELVTETKKAVLVKIGNDGMEMDGHLRIWLGVILASFGLIFAVYVVLRKFNGWDVEVVTVIPT